MASSRYTELLHLQKYFCRLKRVSRRMAKAPNQGTIQPKERIQSTPSETLPPPIFANWAVDPSHQPQVPSTVSVLPISHQDLNNSTDSDSSSD